jgi:DNA repair protein RadC
MENFPLKSWAESDRPREKMILQGRNALTEAELLAILIRSGSRDDTAVELARKILQSVSNDLTQLSRLTVHDFMKFKGIGETKAVTLLAAIELGTRRRSAEAARTGKITSSADAAAVFLPILSDLMHEEFWVLLLSRSNQVIARRQVSKGGVSGTAVDPKIIFRFALEATASGIILCHNHPSGNNKPSDADITLTKRISQAATLMEIQVLDHVIIAGEGYYSFADEGKL